MNEVHEMKTLTLAGEEFNSFQDQQAREDLLKKLPKPEIKAKVGQYLRVLSVDEDGKITGIEPVGISFDSDGDVAYDEAQELTEEQKAQARANIGAQPVGEYLTEVPEGYAKNEDIEKVDRNVDTLREVVSKFHSNIVEEAKGNIITLDDDSDMKLAGLCIFGKTTQNGTPTPDAPVPLESVGDEGSIGVTVCGKNLLDTKTVTNHYYTAEGIMTPHSDFALFNWIPVKQGEKLAFSAKYIGSNEELLRWAFFDRKKNFISRHTSATAKAQETVVNVPADGYIRTFLNTNNYDIATAQLTFGNTVATYEAFHGGSVTVSTPNGLPGIPVASGGNYTDENGQQWVCDELDFVQGLYVKRLGRIVSYAGEVIPNPYLSTTGNLTAGATVLYPLDAPVETTLTDEELATYSALHTSYPSTTIFNDGGAEMEVKYVADTKLYIDKKFTELAEVIVNN